MKTLLFAGLLMCQPVWAWAQPAVQAARELPVCSLAPDGKKLLVEPCRPAPSRNFSQRRSVPSALAPLPQLARPPATAVMPAPAPLSVPVPPPATRPLGPCDAAGCRDAGGARYQGSGPVLLDPSGRPCRTDGQWVQC